MKRSRILFFLALCVLAAGVWWIEIGRVVESAERAPAVEVGHEPALPRVAPRLTPPQAVQGVNSLPKVSSAGGPIKFFDEFNSARVKPDIRKIGRVVVAYQYCNEFNRLPRLGVSTSPEATQARERLSLFCDRVAEVGPDEIEALADQAVQLGSSAMIIRSVMKGRFGPPSGELAKQTLCGALRGVASEPESFRDLRNFVRLNRTDSKFGIAPSGAFAQNLNAAFEFAACSSGAYCGGEGWDELLFCAMGANCGGVTPLAAYMNTASAADVAQVKFLANRIITIAKDGSCDELFDK